MSDARVSQEEWDRIFPKMRVEEIVECIDIIEENTGVRPSVIQTGDGEKYVIEEKSSMLNTGHR